MMWPSRATVWKKKKKKNTVKRQRPAGKISWLILCSSTPKYTKKTYKEVREPIGKISKRLRRNHSQKRKCDFKHRGKKVQNLIHMRNTNWNYSTVPF